FGTELNGSFAFDESRRAASIHTHLIFGGGLQIVQPDRSAEDTVDRAHTESHLQVIRAFARLLQLLATGKALGNPVRVCQKSPDGQWRNSVERELPFDFHPARSMAA